MQKEILTDQTGKFLIRSSGNNQYIAICYDYDSNSILAKAILNGKEESLTQAEKYFIEELTKRGLKPKFQKLDNEISQSVKEYMAQNGIQYQLVPPHIHWRNKAERAIQTFKAHFISGLCTVDPNFPLHLWDKLLPQAIITLNMLRRSNLNPGLSAYQQLYRNFDYNTTPMAPPGTKVLILELATKRGSYDPHGTEGWYIGPSLHHYRCW